MFDCVAIDSAFYSSASLFRLKKGAINNNKLDKYDKTSGTATASHILRRGASSINSYKNRSQRANAAPLPVDAGEDMKTGVRIAFINVRNDCKVRTLVRATAEDVDNNEYFGNMESMLDQATSPPGFHFDRKG